MPATTSSGAARRGILITIMELPTIGTVSTFSSINMSATKRSMNAAVLHTARSPATAAGLTQASPATILATMDGFARTMTVPSPIGMILAGDTAMALA